MPPCSPRPLEGLKVRVCQVPELSEPCAALNVQLAPEAEQVVQPTVTPPPTLTTCGKDDADYQADDEAADGADSEHVA